MDLLSDDLWLQQGSPFHTTDSEELNYLVGKEQNHLVCWVRQIGAKQIGNGAYICCYRERYVTNSFNLFDNYGRFVDTFAEKDTLHVTVGSE